MNQKQRGWISIASIFLFFVAIMPFKAMLFIAIWIFAVVLVMTLFHAWIHWYKTGNLEGFKKEAKELKEYFTK
jgi:hypothetical protein